MAGEGVVFVLVFLLFGVGAPLFLYRLIRAEHGNREVMDRGEAERAARRDTDDDSGRNRR
jgi:hypothetical protein